MHMSASATVNTDTTVADLKAMLNSIPEDAKVRLYVSHGDRPFETGTSEIKFNWNTKGN